MNQYEVLLGWIANGMIEKPNIMNLLCSSLSPWIKAKPFNYSFARVLFAAFQTKIRICVRS